MGVPTITLRGASMIERQGASLLTAAGLTAFIAENPGHYRALVQQHLAAPEKLAALRDGMRAQLLLSPLMDSEAFARDWLEKVFELWHERS
jgi:predicted O-linked N-acetylglucosamine transferase (SPINDLY family)